MLMCGTGSLHVIEPESALNAKSHTEKQGQYFHIISDIFLLIMVITFLDIPCFLKKS